MATLIGYTSLELNEDTLSQLVETVGGAVTTGLGLPASMKSVTIVQIPKVATTPKPYGLITFFAFSAPNKPLDAKRRMVRLVQEAVDQLFGGPGVVRTVVIIKEHTDENVGVAGVMRCDAQKG